MVFGSVIWKNINIKKAQLKNNKADSVLSLVINKNKATWVSNTANITSKNSIFIIFFILYSIFTHAIKIANRATKYHQKLTDCHHWSGLVQAKYGNNTSVRKTAELEGFKKCLHSVAHLYRKLFLRSTLSNLFDNIASNAAKK